MPQQVVAGAMLQCSFGVAPSSLLVPPLSRTQSSYMPAANIMDQKPFVNIVPFGMCTSLANPSVAAATSAALGVLTPMPCVPVIPAPWTPGAPTVLVGGLPALDNTSKCMCMWAGVISIMMPGQFTHNIP
jgi:Domain of unknown function (DUF4280)